MVVSACMNGGHANIVVRDTGAGIASADLERVFDRFYRSNTARDAAGGHVGLGLSITRAIVELHGGGIMIESAVGVGTSVILDLPGAALAERALNAVA